MATNKMLIDASHPEETRVAVVRGNRVEEYDFESQAKRQLRGNIYLAKVTRVEPSLQAAFVEYGGNRHGFLAFSEIHPDYYQIPFADRQALLAEDEDEANEASEPEIRGRSRRPERRRGRRQHQASNHGADHAAGSEQPYPENGTDDEGPAGENKTESRSRADRSPTSGSRDDSGPAEAAEPAFDENDPGGPGGTMSAANGSDWISEPAPGGSDENGGEDGNDGAGDEGKTEPADEAAPVKRRRTRRKSESKKSRAAEAPVVEAQDDTAPAEAFAAESAESRPGEAGGQAIAERERRPAEAASDSGPSPEGEEDEHVESVGQEDALEEVPQRRRLRRSYKIQEVVKRRQIMLVQVVKEERGNKGAALTTYLSLAGRYCVLMPNTGRGGGISRKITNAIDRKRLKEIAGDLEVPQGMGVILRTAGASRTKAEIRRDFEYLLRLWENVRNLTLSSNAPCLVYEEGSLIKRSIRDLYDKDTGEIIVQGEGGYKEAKDFMRMLMPSHAKNVQPYSEDQALFSKHGVETQLDRLLAPQVTLKSGGYLVINQTEALVSIDVNSGKATREHSIEDTALHTNLEASDEVARQLRLRDLAGLIVIDFIDMEENRNNRAVEKRLKEALRHDRARIQVGRISHFGLLEMSRQRIRVSVMESTMDVCPHCQGLGHVRSNSSLALHMFRAIEDHLTRHSRNDVSLRCPTAIAIELLNSKRAGLADLEMRHGVRITIEADATLPGQNFILVKGEAATGVPVRQAHIRPPEDEPADLPEEIVETEEPAPASEVQARPRDDEQGDRKRRRRRRRGRRPDGERDGFENQRPGDDVAGSADEAPDRGEEAVPVLVADHESQAPDGEGHRKRVRGRRGGRNARRPEPGAPAERDEHGAEAPGAKAEREETAPEIRRPDSRQSSAPVSNALPAETASADIGVIAAGYEGSDARSASARKRRPTRRVAATSQTASQFVDEAVPASSAPIGSAKPVHEVAADTLEKETSGQDVKVVEAGQTGTGEPKKRKSGWWRRGGGFF